MRRLACTIHIVSISPKITRGARRYLGYQPWWHATQQAPDESLGADETGRASPVVVSLPFAPSITGSTSSGDSPQPADHVTDPNPPGLSV